MKMEKSPNALRTIGEVADSLGIATHVLRFWESKFNQIKPQKRRGRRYYRPEDVETIIQIKTLLYSHGYTIRGVQKFLASGKTLDDAASTPVSPANDSNDANVGSDTQTASANLSGDNVSVLRNLHDDLKVIRDRLNDLNSSDKADK